MCNERENGLIFSSNINIKLLINTSNYCWFSIKADPRSVAPLDILLEHKAIGMNHLENKICRGIDQKERWDRTMYANGISQKLPTHSLVLRETNMWMKRREIEERD